MDSGRKTLWDMIRGIRYAMLASRDDDGLLRSRPLTTQNRRLDDDDSLWFFVTRTSELALDLGRKPAVNVAYADPETERYVSVAGVAVLEEDPARSEALWSAEAKTWFPDGPHDSNLQLLRVRIAAAEYWDEKTRAMVAFPALARAAAGD